MAIKRIITAIIAVVIIYNTLSLSVFAINDEEISDLSWQSNGQISLDDELLPGGIKGRKTVTQVGDNPNRHKVKIEIESEEQAYEKNKDIIFVFAGNSKGNYHKNLLKAVLPMVLSQGNETKISLIVSNEGTEVLFDKVDYTRLNDVLEAIDEIKTITSAESSTSLYLDNTLRTVRETLLPQYVADRSEMPQIVMLFDGLVTHSSKVAGVNATVICGERCVTNKEKWFVTPTGYLKNAGGEIIRLGNGKTSNNGLAYNRVEVKNIICNNGTKHNYFGSDNSFPDRHHDVAIYEGEILKSMGVDFQVISDANNTPNLSVISQIESIGHLPSEAAVLDYYSANYAVHAKQFENIILSDTLSELAKIDQTSFSFTSTGPITELPYYNAENKTIDWSFSGDGILSYEFDWDIYNPEFERSTLKSVGGISEHPTAVEYRDEEDNSALISLNQPKAMGYFKEIYLNVYRVNYFMKPLDSSGNIVENVVDAEFLIGDKLPFYNYNLSEKLNRWDPNDRAVVPMDSIEVENYILPKGHVKSKTIDLSQFGDPTILIPYHATTAKLTINYEFIDFEGFLSDEQQINVDNIIMGSTITKANLISYTDKAIENGQINIPDGYSYNNIVAEEFELTDNKAITIRLNEHREIPEPTYFYSVSTFIEERDTNIVFVESTGDIDVTEFGNSFIVSPNNFPIEDGYIRILANMEEVRSLDEFGRGSIRIKYKLDKIFFNNQEIAYGRVELIENIANQIKLEYKIVDIEALYVPITYKLISGNESFTQYGKMPIAHNGNWEDGRTYDIPEDVWQHFEDINANYLRTVIYEEGNSEGREIELNKQTLTYNDIYLLTEDAYIEVEFSEDLYFDSLFYFDGVPYAQGYYPNDANEEITLEKLIQRVNPDWSQYYSFESESSSYLPLEAYEVSDNFPVGKGYLEFFFTSKVPQDYQVKFYEKSENENYNYIDTLQFSTGLPPIVTIDSNILDSLDLSGEIDKIEFYVIGGNRLISVGESTITSTVTFDQCEFAVYYTKEIIVDPPTPEPPNPEPGDDDDDDNNNGEGDGSFETMDISLTISLESGSDYYEAHTEQDYVIDAKVYLWNNNVYYSYNGEDYQLKQVEVMKSKNVNSSDTINLGMSGDNANYELESEMRQINEEVVVVPEGSAYVFTKDYDYEVTLRYSKIQFAEIENNNNGNTNGNTNSNIPTTEKKKSSGKTAETEKIDKATPPASASKISKETKEAPQKSLEIPIDNTQRNPYANYNIALPKTGGGGTVLGNISWITLSHMAVVESNREQISMMEEKRKEDLEN